MPRSRRHGRDAAARTTALQFLVVLRQQAALSSTETKKQVSAPKNEAAVFSSPLYPTRYFSTSSSVPPRRFAAKLAQSDLFCAAGNQGAARFGAATGKVSLNLLVKTVRKGYSSNLFFPAVADRAAPQRKTLSPLCADCGNEIDESTDLHPSLCSACEHKITLSATGWQSKKDQPS